MKAGYAAALGWLLIAGLMQGIFPLPMKFTRRWQWEHLWFWYSALAFFVLPVTMALATVPALGRAYSAISAQPLLWTAIFGVTWGVGSVLYGLGIDALGMALGYPIMTAMTTALGALVPMAVLTPRLVWQRAGILTIAGNAVTFAGVGLCALAGERRDRQLGRTPAILGPQRTFGAALLICIAAGSLSAMFNFGYAFGEPIVKSAIATGASRDNALNAVWAVMLPAGGIINLVYCGYLMRKNDSAGLLPKGTGRDWASASAMAALWTFSVLVYGWGANGLGALGPTLGWSLWNAILIVTTVVCGLMTHEWRGVRGTPLRWLVAGIFLLIAGSFVLGAGAA